MTSCCQPQECPSLLLVGISKIQGRHKVQEDWPSCLNKNVGEPTTTRNGPIISVDGKLAWVTLIFLVEVELTIVIIGWEDLQSHPMSESMCRIGRVC